MDSTRMKGTRAIAVVKWGSQVAFRNNAPKERRFSATYLARYEGQMLQRNQLLSSCAQIFSRSQLLRLFQLLVKVFFQALELFDGPV